MRHVPLEPRECARNDIVLEETAPHPFRRVDDEGVGFSERKEPEHMVEVTVGQDDGGNGGVTRRLGMKLGDGFDLTENVGGAVAEYPRPRQPADRDRILGPRCDPLPPSRTERQFSQPQFHWGTPPPAPEPRIRIRMRAT
jgi:hypothetical protein